MNLKHLKPMFPFYGSKHRLAKHYPKPAHGTIIEPFAGSACYSLWHYEMNVILYDADPVVCAVWDYLIRSKPSEIRRLPKNVPSTVDDLKVVQEAKWLIGFWCNKASSTPRNMLSAWAREYPNKGFWTTDSMRERVAVQCGKIDHWTVKNKSYEDADNIKATWFIDPPYYGKPGSRYKYNDVDYQHLAKWCGDAKGQRIVCEQEGADWLPFESFALIRGARKKSKEVVWIA